MIIGRTSFIFPKSTLNDHENRQKRQLQIAHKKINKEPCLQVMQILLQKELSPPPLLPLSMNTVCNCHFPSFSHELAFLWTNICIFHYISNPTVTIQKLKEQREIAIVQGTFAERQVEWISLKVFTPHFCWSIS